MSDFRCGSQQQIYTLRSRFLFRTLIIVKILIMIMLQAMLSPCVWHVKNTESICVYFIGLLLMWISIYCQDSQLPRQHLLKREPPSSPLSLSLLFSCKTSYQMHNPKNANLYICISKDSHLLGASTQRKC